MFQVAGWSMATACKQNELQPQGKSESVSPVGMAEQLPRWSGVAFAVSVTTGEIPMMLLNASQPTPRTLIHEPGTDEKATNVIVMALVHTVADRPVRSGSTAVIVRNQGISETVCSW